MNNRRGLILLAGLFGLLVFIALLQGQGASESSSVIPIPSLAANASQRIFPDWEAEEARFVSLRDPHSEIALILARDAAGVWSIPDSDQEINQELAQGIVQTIAQLPYSQALSDVQPERYPEFGLAREDIVMLVEVIRENGQAHIVAVGGLTPDDAGHYAVVDDREAVYIIGRQPDPVAFLIYYLAESTKNDTKLDNNNQAR